MPGNIQLDPHVRDIFIRYGVRRNYHPGEVLEQKGDAGLQAGFLVEGHIRAFCLSPNGDEISLFYLGPDNLFSSNALVYYPEVMVSLSALSPATAYPNLTEYALASMISDVGIVTPSLHTVASSMLNTM